MAEQLGQAELILTLNDDALRSGLRQLQNDLQNLNTEIRPRVSNSGGGSARGSGTVRGASTPVGDLGRQVQAARDLNLNTNWGVALRTLGEVDSDLALIGASQELNLRQGWTVALQQLTEIAQDLESISSGRDFNIQNSWRTALGQLSEIDADLRQVAAGDRLNLNSSWTKALTQLAEVNEDLRLISNAERLNLNSSWTQALTQLQEIDADLRLISAGQNLNLNTSWTAALSDLNDIKADLDLIAAGRDLNLRTSWQNFLQQLEGVKEDLDAASRQQANGLTKDAIRGRIQDNRNTLGGFGAASRDSFGVTQQTRRDQLDADLARVREKRVAAEKSAAEATAATAKAEREAAAAALQRAADRKQRVKDAVGSAIIGGAFPALFGQGLGASVGGGVGGAVGGALGGQFGFGLSLVGTALGQAFDNALQKAKTLAQGLDDPITSFTALKDAALFSSQAVEKNVAALIEAGRAEEAAVLARQDLNKQYGGAEGAKELLAATDELNRAWTQATVVLTAFVAGPLANFLKAIAAGLGGGSTQYAIQDNKRANEIINSSPEARQQFVDLAKQRGVKLNSDLKVSSEDIGKRVSLVQEFLKARGELTASQKDDLQISNALLAPAKRRQEIEKATLGILEAQASGDRLGAYDKQAQLIKTVRDSQLAQLPVSAPTAQRDAINKKASDELKKLEIERGSYERQLFAERIASANKLLDLEQQISIAQQRGSGTLTSAGIGALQTAAGLEAAKRQEQNAQAQLRVRPEDQGLQNAAKEAAKQTQIAAANARADLIEASKAAELSVRNIAQSLQDAVLAQQQLVGTNQGLTGILGGQAAYNRQKQVNEQLQNDVVATKKELLSSSISDPNVRDAIARKEFSGSLSDQNRQMIQFIEAARQEMRGAQGIDDIQKQLVKAQNDLVTINGKLYEVNQQVVTAVSKLAEKNWVVNVNVPGGSASGDVVGAINSRT